MPMLASRLRSDIYRILDEVVPMGVPVLVERLGLGRPATRGEYLHTPGFPGDFPGQRTRAAFRGADGTIDAKARP
jgi:hypothetical protein